MSWLSATELLTLYTVNRQIASAATAREVWSVRRPPLAPPHTNVSPTQLISAIAKSIPHITGLDLAQSYHPHYDNAIKLIATAAPLLPQLKLLHVPPAFAPPPTDDDMIQLAALRNLTALRIPTCTDISVNGIRALSSLNALTSLTLLRLRAAHIPDDMFIPLGTLQLKTLVLEYTGVGTLMHLRILNTIPTITTLTLANAKRIPSDVASAIAGLPKLNTLALARCSISSPTLFFQALSRLPSLTHLTAPFDPNTAALLPAFHSLKELNFNDPHGIGDERLHYVADLLTLQSFSSHGSGAGHQMYLDTGLSQLLTSQSLRSLRLVFCSVSGTGFTMSGAQHHTLTALNLSYCALTDDGLIAIASSSAALTKMTIKFSVFVPDLDQQLTQTERQMDDTNDVSFVSSSQLMTSASPSRASNERWMRTSISRRGYHALTRMQSLTSFRLIFRLVAYPRMDQPIQHDALDGLFDNGQTICRHHYKTSRYNVRLLHSDIQHRIMKWTSSTEPYIIT